jgi:branched-chain amino acid aminotransferase
MKVSIDGELLEGAQARVPVYDHGFLYGDGIFEGMRAFRGKVFKLDWHMERLGHGVRALHLQVPGGIERMREIVAKTLAAHTGSDDVYLRLIITRGDGPLGVDPTTCPAPRVVCIADRIALFSDEKRAQGLALVTSSFRRPSSDVLDPRVKTLNYLNNVLSKGEARRQGADDALLLNQRGDVAEASVANVFVVRGGELFTPPTTDGALDGINRRAVLELARELGIPSQVRTLGRMDLFGADEVFLTGTGAGILRVRALDGEAIGGSELGPITKRIASAHRELREG